MIHLQDVSQSLLDEVVGRKLILRNASASVPTRRRVALLGTDPKSLTEVLAVLAGVRKPDSGRVDVPRIRRSPVINSGGSPGSTLAPQLTALENIRFAARASGLDEAALVDAVESSCHFGRLLTLPVRTFDWPTRRRLETAMIAALPFDCYFVDRLHELEGPFVWRLVHVASKRGAGIVFTSRRANQTLRVAEIAARVRNGSLELLHEVADAIDENVH